MAGIVELLLGLFDVLEAEARSLKMGFLRVAGALLLLVVAVLLVLGGLLLLLWAVYLWLSSLLSAPLSALLVGLLSLLLAGGLWWQARRMMR